ncbi:MAG: hypothetical protein K1X29_07385 [Bdellovibrionales bacterium]|nr:hypothetical protein [Bdellovibrionales bacterium]
MIKFLSKPQECFCAFCGSTRKVLRRRQPLGIHFFGSAILTAIITLLVWEELHPKGLVLWGIIFSLLETSNLWLWRIGIICPHCGFDPILYLKNPQQAAKRVRNLFDRKKQKEDFLFTGQALIAVQKRITREKKSTERRSSLSHNVTKM